MTASGIEICANCDREIGNLEQCYLYEDHVVCLECCNRLKGQSSQAPSHPINSPSHEVGVPIATGVQSTQAVQVPNVEILPEYAGFWWRFAAVFIDGIILNIGGFIIGFIIGFAWAAAAGTAEGVGVLANLVGIVIGWLYFALMESSSTQGTLGKMALGIIVTDANGDRVSFGRATGRHFAKLISFLTLFIGFIMAGFTEKKQALHDMIASCLVIKKT